MVEIGKTQNINPIQNKNKQLFHDCNLQLGEYKSPRQGYRVSLGGDSPLIAACVAAAHDAVAAVDVAVAVADDSAG